MVEKINGLKSNPNDGSICKKVEQKASEIQLNSVYDSKERPKSEYVNEAAFLLTVFDKDNNGKITTEELDATSKGDYDAAKSQYNQNCGSLKLDSYDWTKSKIQKKAREDGDLEGKFSNAESAALSLIDSNENKKDYLKLAKTILEYESNPNLSEKDKKLLIELKNAKQHCSENIDPEALAFYKQIEL